MKDIALFELREALKVYKEKQTEAAKYSKSPLLQSRAKGEAIATDLTIDALYYILTGKTEEFNSLLLYLSEEEA